MGLLQDMIKKWRERKEAAETMDIDDNATKDRYLRSLRRERRIQLEEVEKEELKKVIEAYKQARTRRYLWGVKDEAEKVKKRTIAKKRAQINALENKLQSHSYFHRTRL